MKIVRIEPSKHKKGRILVFLQDDTLLKVTENEVLIFGLHSGLDLAEDTVQALKGAAEASDLRQTAAAMTARRMLSGQEVRRRLIKKGAEESEAEDTVQWLQELGAVDDAAYAAVLGRHYGAMGCGPGRVRQELQKRGIPRELWDEALSQLPPAEEAIRQYISAKWRPGDERMGKKIADALLRRGFSWNDIRPILREWEQDEDEIL